MKKKLPPSTWGTRTAAVALFLLLVPSTALGYGEPVDGYPSHDERVILVTINRVRAAPNDQAAGNAAACSTPKDPVPPVAYDARIGHASRFHCLHLSKNAGGLSHQTFCTLDPAIATNGCDGAASCSCVAGTECWSCDTLGGCGSGPNERASIFGFPGGVGEVGAAGYGPSGAATGWATECPPDEPHRNTLTSGGYNVIGTGSGTGGSCWGAYEFADFGSDPAAVVSRIASAVDHDGVLEANWYDVAGDPTSIDAVIDGACTPMEIAVGVNAGNRDYQIPFVPSGACQQWYVIATAPDGTIVRYPDVGSLTAGCPEDYVPTQLDAPCASCNQGETRPCDNGTCSGTQTCGEGVWGPCDAPATCDMGSGGGSADGGAGSGANGAGDGGNGDSANGGDEGCSCSTPGGEERSGAPLLALVAGVVLAGARRAPITRGRADGPRSRS